MGSDLHRSSLDNRRLPAIHHWDLETTKPFSGQYIYDNQYDNQVQVRKDQGEIKTSTSPNLDCERFPDQCPFTNEWGNGIV
jgi:hypothetical protein